MSLASCRMLIRHFQRHGWLIALLYRVVIFVRLTCFSSDFPSVTNLLVRLMSVRAVMKLSVLPWKFGHLSASLVLSVATFATVPGLSQAAPLKRAPAPAGKTIAYLLPIDEGYGLSDCLARGHRCAFRVANAWCKAHGRGAAVSVGKADDVTGSIAGQHRPLHLVSVPARHSVVVTCRL
ncbi:MAG: hypothetical protein KGQ37_00280 [Hyphomicrobiales bacterium]|nr:hypothetical protein [Hyphomicrobiales bacterium]